MEIDTAIDKCLADAGNMLSSQTAKTYATGLRHLAGWLNGSVEDHNVGISELSAQTLIDYISWLAAQDFTRATLQVYVAAMKYFHEWLLIQDLVELSPNDGIRLRKSIRNLTARKGKRMPRTPDKGDDLKMVKASKGLPYPSPIRERNRAIIELLFSSGCRANELAGLRVRDVDLKERSALVIGKGDKERRAYFSSEAARALQAYYTARGQRGAGDPVFCRHDRGAGKKVKPLTTATIRSVVADVAMVAGIDPHAFTPHAFRHAFGIRMLQETNNLALVQDLLGHSDPGTTRVYATIYPEDMKAAHREVFG